jgi:hypothetical protein
MIPVFEREKTVHALIRAANVIGTSWLVPCNKHIFAYSKNYTKHANTFYAQNAVYLNV